MANMSRLAGTARMSAAVIVNGVVYTKGITARGGPSDIAGQTQSCLGQLDALLAVAGTGKARLIKVMIWLRDMADFEAMNVVYDGWVAPDGLPVRACVQAELADPSLLIEIQAEALA
ncbi:RidA family protein [Pelagibacterium mangrovi]|uniref:RidA family protein n=1 Tax=Pelagibacterium mangrovi TaxID=3119828 RepID=UPI002FCB8827